MYNKWIANLVRVCLIIFFTAVFQGCGKTDKQIESTGEIAVHSAVIYPKIRVWTSPSNGEETALNPPSLQWPSKKKVQYSVRLSTTKEFSKNLIEKSGIPYAIFNPHRKLDEGIWYWQYKANSDEWSKVDSFRIGKSSRIFTTPEIATVIKNISSEHPRVLVKKDDLSTLRIKARSYKETSIILREANGYVGKPAPKESSASPKLKGKNDFESKKLAKIASKSIGKPILRTLNTLSQAYILTGDEKYFNTSRIWMLEVSTYDPKGTTHISDFGDSGIMTGLAIALDTFWDKLTKDERDVIIKQIAARASGFYTFWTGNVESRSSSMHVWQHIMHGMFQTSLALVGETPEANKWLEYIYEIWIAQSPKMAETDGAWFNGTGYFSMNTITLYDIPDVFTELTGVDFMFGPWYRNNLKWLLYAFPPGSVADGFCNDGDKYEFPNLSYTAYADAAARRFKDRYAVLYAKKCGEDLELPISANREWAWYRISKGYKEELPKMDKDFRIPQAEVFPDVGVAYMHTTLPEIKNNLMLSIRSSPFGPMAHAHAEQNSFNIAYGGKRLFYNTGYRPAMGDPHFVDWHKHTRGHNSVLIDGKGQPYNAGAYGWIPRFVHGKQISYAVGDASNAYSGKDEGQNIDFGMQLFKRHYIMLRPSILVIYDELEADHPAEWSWLIHNDTGIEMDVENKTLFAENELANAQVNLYSSSPINYELTDEFSVPVTNWTNKKDREGNTIVYHNQWHFSGISKERTNKMRYLAIIRIKPKTGKSVCEEVIFDTISNTYTVGEWNIKAEMDVYKAAKIEINDNLGTASFVSSGELVLDGKNYGGSSIGSSKLVEVIDDKKVFREVVDTVPAAIKSAMLRDIGN